MKVFKLPISKLSLKSNQLSLRKRLQPFMGAISLHFVYLALHNVMSIFSISLAWLVHIHVSHDLGWNACACSICYNFHYIK